METTARMATAADAALVADLVDAAVVEQAEARGGPVWSVRETRQRPALESVRADIDDPDVSVIVGEIDGAVVGFGTLLIEDLRDGSRLGVVSELFVLPEAREVGLGEVIMAPIIDRCRAAGCRGIDAHALPGNRLTKNFFESFGFTARLLVVHHRLEPDRPDE